MEKDLIGGYLLKTLMLIFLKFMLFLLIKLPLLEEKNGVNILLVTMEKKQEAVMKLIFISRNGLLLTNLIKTQ